MNKHPSPNITPHAPASGVPENAPIVAVNINLGEKYKNVDFDYQKFDEEATRLGISDETKSNLQVNINPPDLPRTNYGKVEGGRKIGIKARKRANRALTHELQHVADRDTGVKYNEKRYRLGQFAVLSTGRILIPLDIAGNIASKVAGSPLAEEVTRYGLLPASVAAVAAATAGYGMHPKERKARKAARQSKADILTLEKK